jgi:hypothetical protein
LLDELLAYVGLDGKDLERVPDLRAAAGETGSHGTTFDVSIPRWR